MKDILKLSWKVAKGILYPFIKRKAKELLKSYLWSLVRNAMIIVALAAAIATVILIFYR